MVRPTYVEIDLGAIVHNVSTIRELIAPSLLCTVVKADAYGHGDVPVAGAALEAGASMLAVALVEEGARLRESGIEAPILLLSEPRISDVAELDRWQLTPTVYSQDLVAALDVSGAAHAVHVAIDTGMHRVGARADEVGDLVSSIERAPHLHLEGMWSHFAVADEDPEFTMTQIGRFDEAMAGYRPSIVHLANTPGAILFPEARRDMCRVGLGTYGLHPCEETREHVDLVPAMRLVSHVSHVQRLESGARPSYGRVRALERSATVATVPVGYADGFRRALTAGGRALIGGESFPLAGSVTMDQIMVDVGDEDVAVGDEVVLLGSQGDAEITADDWAGRIGTISYEITCAIGPRVPRRYL